LGQSLALLDKGLCEATRRCLWEYGKYSLKTARDDPVDGGSSRVDYVALVNNERRALCEAKSPSVMKKVGGLPPRGIELTWVRGQSLVPKILAKVSTPLSISYNTGFEDICVGRFVSGSETDGMAVYYLPQLLDRVPSCEG
jgi:hypothetical protein